MPNAMSLPILKDLIPGSFGYGVSLVVEFEPHSIWYETSLTIAADALRNGIRTDYHAYMHPPDEIVNDLQRLGLDIAKLEEGDVFRILDSYSVQVGAKPRKSKASSHYSESMDVANWKYARRDEMGKGVDESHKKRLHVDDNTTIMLQYNSEAKYIEVIRTRARPYWIALELAMVNAMATGVASSGLYGQFEMLNDGIIDLKAEERGGQIEHLIRVRKMRGRAYDSSWHRLQLTENGEVRLND